LRRIRLASSLLVHGSMPPRRLVAALLPLWIAACGSSDGGSTPNPDAAPIRLKEPSARGEGETADGCNGVTAAGWCREGVAEKCDLATGKVGRVMCRDQGQECIYHRNATGTGRGATCQAVDASCATGLTEAGRCSADGALWCEDGATQVWECGSAPCGDVGQGLQRCQDASGGEDCTPCPPGLADDVMGQCTADGKTAQWCTQGCLRQDRCSEQGLTCGPGPQYDAECIVTTGGSTGCQPDAAEPDDNSTQARQLAEDWHFGYLADDQRICAGDQDWYATPLFVGEPFVAELRFTHADGDLDLLLYDPSGTLAAASMGFSDDERIAHTAAVTGTYHVKVRGWGDGTNDYDLNVYVDW
jgi:hypothetical protein